MSGPTSKGSAFRFAGSLCLPEQAFSICVAADFPEKSRRNYHVDYMDGQAYDGFMAKRKNPHAVALSKLGASKGGQARAAKLTPEQRKAIARAAARARWAAKKADGQS
jgi:hypothetical protein